MKKSSSGKIYLYKSFLWLFAGTTLYYMNKNYRIFSKFKYDYILPPVVEMLNSKEIKGAGIDLLEEIFKDNRTIKTTVLVLKDVIKDNYFEEEYKKFIKIWLLNVFKDKKFLNDTKVSIISMLNSNLVTTESGYYIKTLVNENSVKDFTADFFKDIFLDDKVLLPFSNLLQNCALNSLQSDRIITHGTCFFKELLTNKELMSKIYWQAADVYSILKSEQKYFDINQKNEVVQTAKAHI